MQATPARAGIRELLLFFGIAVAIRVALLQAASRATGWAPLDHAMLGDGHLDLIVAKTFPKPYAGAAAMMASMRIYREKPQIFLLRFPLHPALIWLGSHLVHDARMAALSVAQIASAMAVVCFRRLADDFSARPRLAAALFTVFPATWLVAGTLAYCEPLMLLCAVSAFHASHEGRRWQSAGWAAFGSLAQKHALLILPIAAAGPLLRRGLRALPEVAPLAAALVPIALLQVYVYSMTGDPLANVRQVREFFGGPLFGWPLLKLFEGFVAPTQLYLGHFWLRKAMILLSALFYGVVLAAGVRRRDTRTAPLVAWLGLSFAFCISLGSGWAYYNFPRFMLLGAPPAILLAVEYGPWPRRRGALVMVVTVLAACAWVAALVDIRAIFEVCLRAWPPPYYEHLRPMVR